MAILVLPQMLYSQTKKPAYAKIEGVVVEKGSSVAIDAAMLTIDELGLFSYTNEKGEYSFSRVPLGRASIIVRCIGRVTATEVLFVDEPKTYQIIIEMETASFRLEEVKVIAQGNRSGLSSSTTVPRSAIEHLQAASLGDVLQLIPGQLADNPTMKDAELISLRQVGSDNLNSLGTAIIIDGSPISNNANLQASDPAFEGETGYSGSVSGKGIDLRQISTENIESIEVIKGIPSAEHGDLTTGALLLETRAGPTPYQFRARLNPLITQFNAGKGFSLGERYGSLNVDFDYLESIGDQRQAYQGYDRLTLQLTYTNQFFQEKRLHTTTTLSGFTTIDETRQDPDDQRNQREHYSKDRGFRLNTTGRWNLDWEYAQNIKYNLSVNYMHQVAFNKELLSGYIYPLSVAKNDTTMAATIVPSEYISKVTIDGKPLNIFAKVTSTFFKDIYGFKNRIMIGIDWRTDVNFGEGKMYDVTRPPLMEHNQASRPRPYKDIPALNQVAYYIEDNIHRVFNEREFSMQIGLRYDVVTPINPFRSEIGSTLAPRLNASYELFKNFKLHGGYGITAKSPTLLHLYPNPAYFDLVNYNYYAPKPEERLILVTTRVFDTQNYNLELAKNIKQEIGIDYSLKNIRLSVTAFYEKLKNGYGFYNHLAFIPVEIFEASEFPDGKPPILAPEPIATETFIGSYNKPMNTRETLNRGIEFDLDFGRISSIRTSFNINGAYINTKMYGTDYEYWVNYFIIKAKRAAVFPSGAGINNTRLNTALRVIHNIPDLQFVVSLTVQTIWIERSKAIGYDYVIMNAGTTNEKAVRLPLAYIKENGDLIYLDKEEALLPEYDDIRQGVGDANLRTLDYPPLWLFNIRLSKDIGKSFGFAFYANNMFMHRPLHYNQQIMRYVKRNPQIFFGTEMYIKF